jgi:hypothetical protein
VMSAIEEVAKLPASLLRFKFVLPLPQPVHFALLFPVAKEVPAASVKAFLEQIVGLVSATLLDVLSRHRRCGQEQREASERSHNGLPFAATIASCGVVAIP